jgi:hypothetical protein
MEEPVARLGPVVRAAQLEVAARVEVGEREAAVAAGMAEQAVRVE